MPVPSLVSHGNGTRWRVERLYLQQIRSHSFQIKFSLCDSSPGAISVTHQLNSNWFSYIFGNTGGWGMG